LAVVSSLLASQIFFFFSPRERKKRGYKQSSLFRLRSSPIPANHHSGLGEGAARLFFLPVNAICMQEHFFLCVSLDRNRAFQRSPVCVNMRVKEEEEKEVKRRMDLYQTICVIQDLRPTVVFSSNVLSILKSISADLILFSLCET